MNKKEIGLYIHIPFCAQKCDYCDFISFANKEDKIEAALNAFPEAVKKALIFLASAHGLKSILLGNIDMTNAGKVLRDSTSQPNFQSNSSNNNQLFLHQIHPISSLLLFSKILKRL